jgi:hypothetical protein
VVLSLRTANRYKGVREAFGVESVFDFGPWTYESSLGSLHFALLKEMITGLEAFA